MATGSLAIGLCAPLGCGFDASGEATTDVVLDTGAETTDSTSSGGELQTTGTGDPGEGDASGSGSSSGEPPDPGTSTGTDDSTSTGKDSETSEELCGNGNLDEAEDCDGAVVTKSCAELDALYTEGMPACDAGCKFDTSPCVACEAPSLKPCDNDSDEPLHALELGCDTVTGWEAHESVPLLDDDNQSYVASLDATSYRVVRRFGSHESAWAPRAGSKALLIGTGSFEPADADGIVTDQAGDAQYGGNNLNPDSDGGLPEKLRIHPIDGGSAPFTDCDGENDCSNTLADQWSGLSPKNAKDIFWLEIETVVPPGTRGYAIDLAFFTSHYPEYNDSTYNDMVVLWSDSEAHVGNVSYLRDGDAYRPLSLPELVKAGWMTHDGTKDPMLAGTGYDLHPNKVNSQGGASEWLTIEGPAVPGESLILTLALMDLEDSAFDSAILVDNFRWSCAGCELEQSCGVRLADAL